MGSVVGGSIGATVGGAFGGPIGKVPVFTSLEQIQTGHAHHLVLLMANII